MEPFIEQQQFDRVILVGKMSSSAREAHCATQMKKTTARSREFACSVCRLRVGEAAGSKFPSKLRFTCFGTNLEWNIAFRREICALVTPKHGISYRLKLQKDQSAATGAVAEPTGPIAETATAEPTIDSNVQILDISDNSALLSAEEKHELIEELVIVNQTIGRSIIDAGKILLRLRSGTRHGE